MKAYRLKRDGQIVHTSRQTTIAPDGREEHVTRGKVGRAGEVFTELPEHVTSQIDAGELDDIWEPIDIESLTEEAEAEIEVADEGSASTAPVETAESHRHSLNFSVLPSEDLVKLVQDHRLDVQGTGAGGNLLRKDMISALESTHPHDWMHDK